MKQNKLDNIKKTGFKVPKDYFHNLEDTLFDNIKLNEKIQGSGFKMPEDYIDTLEETIVKKVSKKEDPKVVKLFNKRNLVYVSSIAAAIVLLLNISFFKDDPWDLDIETVENYIINEDISYYEIAALLNDEDLLEEDFVEHDFNQDVIDEYMIDNLEIEDLILE